MRYLTLPIPIKPFRDALQEEYGREIRIVHERGIQEAYSRLTEPRLAGKAVRDRGSEARKVRFLTKEQVKELCGVCDATLWHWNRKGNG